jgi:hypothetical protein
MILAADARRLDSYRAASSTAQSSTSARYCRPARWWSMLCPAPARWRAETSGDAVNAAAKSPTFAGPAADDFEQFGHGDRCGRDGGGLDDRRFVGARRPVHEVDAHEQRPAGVARGEEPGHRAGAGREDELLGHQVILPIAGVGSRIPARACRVTGVFHSPAQSADTAELAF